MLKVIIAKPTEKCNANCSYCSAMSIETIGPINAQTNHATLKQITQREQTEQAEQIKQQWTFEDFKCIWDKLSPHLSHQARWIWHGGEPLLLSPGFYRACAEYAWKTKPTIKFILQSNLLLYETKKWSDVFRDIFKGNIGTSYDPEEKYRTINGDPKVYSELFHQKLKIIKQDGFNVGIISTYSDENAHTALSLYEFSLKKGPFDLRFNYRYPSKYPSKLLAQDQKIEEEKSNHIISSEVYAEILTTLWDRWINDAPNFMIMPHFQLLQKIIGHIRGNGCPWTRSCLGHYLCILPNGDSYNCSGLADLNNRHFCFGNIFRNTIYTSENERSEIIEQVDDNNWFLSVLQSKKLWELKKLFFDLPNECKNCDDYPICYGGCFKDIFLLNDFSNNSPNNSSNKKEFPSYSTPTPASLFPYCSAWKQLINKIKYDINCQKIPDKYLKPIHTMAYKSCN